MRISGYDLIWIIFWICLFGHLSIIHHSNIQYEIKQLEYENIKLKILE